MLRRLVFAFSLLMAACGALPADQPVGIILDADGSGRIERPSNPVPIPALPGVELYPGDVFLKAPRSVRFAFCPLKRIQTLEAGKTFRLDAAVLPKGDLLTGQSTVEVCELPEMSPFPEARPGKRRAPHPGDPHDPRVVAVDEGLAGALGDKTTTPPMLRRIARARRLYAAGLAEESVAEYDAVEAEWKGASWVADLTGSILMDEARGRGVRVAVEVAPAGPVGPKQPAFTGKTYALVIGISDYQPDSGIQSLQYAHADAETFADFLKSERGGKLRQCEPGQTADCEIELLKNERATLAAVTDAFDRFIAAHASPDNRLFIFIAAHGVDPALEQNPVTRETISKEPVILTYDSSYSDVKLTGYPMHEVRDHANRAALAYQSVVVFADVCRAYNIIGAIPFSPDLQPDVQKQLLNSGIAFFMASSVKQESWESQAFGEGHGAFSYAVLQGLSRPDLPRDEPLSYNDLKLYVDPLVSKLTNRTQTPQEFFPQPELTLIPDVSLPSIELKPATPLSKAATSRRPQARGAQPPGRNASAQTPLDERDLTDPKQALERMRNSPAADANAIDAYAARLQVALENRGQQVLIDYLKGDQIEPNAAGFTRCAGDFRAANDLAGSSPFDTSRALFCEARALMFQKDQPSFERAEQLLLESIRLDSKRSYAYNALGIAYLEQASKDSRYYTLAETALREAIRYAPYWPYPWHNLALVSTQEGHYDPAIQQYRQAMAIEPSYSYLPYNLGLLYQRLNRRGDAARSYTQALLLARKARDAGILHDPDGRRPQEAAAENALGALAADNSRFGKGAAEKHYLEAKALDPLNIAPRHNLAVLLAAEKRPAPEAEELWRGILMQDPTHLPARLALARYSVETGATAQGLREYRELLDRYSDFEVGRRELAGVLLKAGQPAESLSELSQVRNTSSEDAVLFERIGDAAAAARDDRTRIAAWNRALSLAQSLGRNGAAKRIRRKLGEPR